MALETEQSREVHINQAQENSPDVALSSLPCKWSDIKMYKLKFSDNMLSVLIELKNDFQTTLFLLVVQKERWK